MKKNLQILSITFFAIPLCHGMERELTTARWKIARCELTLSSAARCKIGRDVQALINKSPDELSLSEITCVRNTYFNMIQISNNQKDVESHDKWTKLFQEKKQEVMQQVRQEQWKTLMSKCSEKRKVSELRLNLHKSITASFCANDLQGLEKGYKNLLATYSDNDESKNFHLEQYLQETSDIKRDLALQALKPHIDAAENAETLAELSSLACLIEKRLVLYSQDQARFSKEVENDSETLARIYRQQLMLAQDDATRALIGDKLVELEI